MQCKNRESLGRLIYLTSGEIKNFAEKLLAPFDLTLEQFHLLKNLSRDEGASQRALGEMTGKTPANVTRILARLEQKNLVCRRRSRRDRRTIHVHLTDRGTTLVREVFSVFETFSERLTAGVPEEKQRETRRVLETITENIKSMSLDMEQQ
ncbi:MAG: hypothetical protein Kow0089_06380 [Desulfobulbaceae bacterium]